MVWGSREQSDDQIIQAFATRAFRRPVSKEQIAPYLHLAQTSPEGLRSAVKPYSVLRGFCTFKKMEIDSMIMQSPPASRIFYGTQCGSVPARRCSQG